MISLDIPIKDKKNPPVLKFPDRCVNCGKPKVETLGITLQMGVQKRGQNVSMDLKVPMCSVCADRERGIAKVTLVPFLIGGLVIGLIVFVPVTLLAPEGTSTQTLSLPWMIGSIAGLIAGILGGSVIELIVKTMAAPFYGKLVMQRPLTIFGVFSEGDQLIGVAAKLLNEKNTVHLTFENDMLAREFKKLNALENE